MSYATAFEFHCVFDAETCADERLGVGPPMFYVDWAPKASAQLQDGMADACTGSSSGTTRGLATTSAEQ